MTFPRIQKIHRKTPGVPFMEQPQDHRFFVRDLITLFGGRIEAYTRTGGFHLAFPADPQDRLALIRVLKHLGWGPKVVVASWGGDAWYYGANFVEIKDDETTDQPDALVS